MSPEQQADSQKPEKAKKFDWRIARLIGTRLVAAGMVTTAFIGIKTYVDRLQEKVEALQEIECEGGVVLTPSQTQDCDQLEASDTDSTGNILIYSSLAIANALIVTDTVARYRALRRVGTQTQERLSIIEQELGIQPPPDSPSPN